MSLYADLLNTPEWKQFRLSVLNYYGHHCMDCKSCASLQVHHRYYIRGRLPWMYAMSQLEVLCSACHSERHPRQNLQAKLKRRLAISSGIEREAIEAALKKIR